MKFTHTTDLRIYGNLDFRDKKCPREAIEQITFFNWVRREYPNTYGKIATHIRNEGKKTVQQQMRHKAEGMTTGASDIMIPAKIPFICELKRQDRTLCAISNEQIEYLKTAQELGAFCCVALGFEAAKEAFLEWLTLIN